MSEIKWDRLIKNRAIALATRKGLPKYLLYPEIVKFLAACEKKVDDYYLFYTLWISGARITEALQLTPSDFYLQSDNPHIMLPNLKPSADQTDVRFIPLEGHDYYISEMRRYLHLRMENGKKKITPKARIWPVTRQAAHNKIKRITASLDDPIFNEISTKTFRHSCAVNHLLHGATPKQIASLLGHSSTETTEIYLNVLTPEIGHILGRSHFNIAAVPQLDKKITRRLEEL